MLLTAMLLLGAMGLVGGGGWLALRLIVNPASVRWLTALLPWGGAAAAQPQSWSEIAAEVGQTGQTLGTPVYFSTYPGLTRQQAGFDDLLLPVLRPLKHCPDQESGCAQITELRVYRPRAGLAAGLTPGMTYDLLDRISVTGPEELVVVAPLARSSSATQGTSRILPFTQVSFVETQPRKTQPVKTQPSPAAPGIWLQLSGEWRRGSRVLYGQIVQYDPERSRLFPFQTWSSPAGQFPTWQQVTGDGTNPGEPELVVNQSVGLEPQFQVFQLKPPRSIGQSVSLEAITLTEAMAQNRTYLNGLLLARNGLWSPALALLQAAKPQMAPAGKWSAQAQAQLDLVQLHAQITQTQASRDWASPTQQILAQVTDGRWDEALETVQRAHRSGYDVRNLLATNAERLWQRVETALRVDANPRELQAWGMLILAVRQNRQQAISWLQKQPNSARLTAVQQTLAVLDPPGSDPAQPPAQSAQIAAAPTSTVPSASLPVSLSVTPVGLIGSVTPLAAVQRQDWASPVRSVSLSLPPAQSWYRIAPIRGAALPAQVERWAAEQVQLQLVVWQGEQSTQIPVTVRAVKASGAILLASGPPLPSNATAQVAITPDVSWLQPQASFSLNELAQRPDWKTVLPQLWQELQAAQILEPQPDPLAAIGDWTVQTLELTGDPAPEQMLTIQTSSGQRLHTVIFSNQAILYSDLTTPDQSLVAIADRSGPPTLIVQQGQDLQLWRWQNQQFQPAEE